MITATTITDLLPGSMYADSGGVFLWEHFLVISSVLKGHYPQQKHDHQFLEVTFIARGQVEVVRIDPEEYVRRYVREISPPIPVTTQ